ncbi:hypothetical protein [Kitasatospora sp. NPDC057223]|uniref:hypothetical protein n=1 Tax=Kitasatospora sp. NPDC057223 TaxID=3346055 RepID=UPI0036277EEF
MKYREAEDRADVLVPHAFQEHTVDLGEVRLNYCIVSGVSSGGVIAASLSAFANPGRIRAAAWEDAPCSPRRRPRPADLRSASTWARRWRCGASGSEFTYRSLPDVPHSTHAYEPELYRRTMVEWVSTLE